MRELTMKEMEQVDGGHQSGGLPVAGMGLSLDLMLGNSGGAAVGLGNGASSIDWFGAARLSNNWYCQAGAS